MSNPAAYMGQPEILAAQLKYDRLVHVTLTGSPLPDIDTASANTIHLLFNPMSKHYDSLILPSPPTVTVTDALPTGA